MNYPRVRSIFVASAIWAWCSAASAQPAPEQTAILTGVVQDPIGIGIWGAPVILESMSGRARYETRSDQQGVFRFSGLPAGALTLSIRAVGFDLVKAKLDLLAGEQRSLPPIRPNVGPSGCFTADADPVRTRFLSGDPSLGGLVGNVQSGLGPAVGAHVALACWIGRGCTTPENTVTDSLGNFKIENIHPGRYLMSIEQSGFFLLSNVGFVVAGGLESSYSFKLDPCPNGDCTIKPSQSNVKGIVCE